MGTQQLTAAAPGPGTTGSSVIDLVGESVVIVVGDDVADRHLKDMPALVAMAAEGVIFPELWVPDPSCSPTRASLYTGQMPLNHGILGVDGSAQEWIDDGLDAISIATLVVAAGGKAYLVGKNLHDTLTADGGLYNPPFTRWFITDEAYKGFRNTWRKNDGSTITSGTAGTAEVEYANDVLAAESVEIIEWHNTNHPGVPFVLIIAPQPPHGNHKEDPQTLPRRPEASAAPRHREAPITPAEIAEWAGMDGGGWTAPDPGDNHWNSVDTFDDPDAPWNNKQPTDPVGTFEDTVMGSTGLANARIRLQDRTRALQSVSDLITTVRAALVTEALDASTHVVWTADNGLHDAEWSLADAKGWLLPTDCRVRTIWVPPGGTTPRTESALVTTADLTATVYELMGIAAPAHLDGYSMVPLLDQTAYNERKRLPLVFRTTKSWEQRLGTGQAASADGTRGEDINGIQYLYVEHDPGAGPPDPSLRKGMLFVLTGPEADPYCMKNRYGQLTPASRQAFHDSMREICDATEAAQLAAALVPLPVAEFGGADPGDYTPESFLIGDFELMTHAKRIQVIRQSWGGRRGTDYYRPYRDGATYVPDKRRPAARFELHVLVRGCNDDGTLPVNPAAVDQVRDHIDAIAAQLNVDVYRNTASTDGLIPFLRTRRDGRQRQARGQIIDVITPDMHDRYLGTFVIVVDVPEGCWRTPARITQTVLLADAFDPDDTSGTVQATLLDGGTYPIQDPRLTFYGPIPGPFRVTDRFDGTGLTINESLAAGERIEMIVDEYSLRKYTSDADETGTDIRSSISDRKQAGGPWIRLEPSPNNLRYSIDLNLDGLPGTGAAVKFDAAIRYANG